MYKYRRKKKIVPDPKIKRTKEVAEYYEKYIEYSYSRLSNKNGRENELLNNLKEQVDLVSPKLSSYNRVQIEIGELQRKKGFLNLSNSRIKSAIEKHQEYASKGFVAKILSSPPKNSIHELEKSYNENNYLLNELHKQLELIESDAKSYDVTIQDKKYGQSELFKLLKSLKSRIGSAEIRIEAQIKGLEFLRNKEAEMASKELEAAMKVDSYKAYAAAYFDQTRKLASTIKKSLQNQEALLSGCPYCGTNMGNIPHADHIYPVAKGGLSTIKNMVLVCSTCNLKKSDRTLREFIVRNGLKRDFVEENLKLLKKHF
jgi:chromosome segregation ATPase